MVNFDFDKDWIERVKERYKKTFDFEKTDRIPGHGWLRDDPVWKLRNDENFLANPDTEVWLRAYLKRWKIYEELEADVVPYVTIPPAPGSHPIGKDVSPYIGGRKEPPLKDIREIRNWDVEYILNEFLLPSSEISRLKNFVRVVKGRIPIYSGDHCTPHYLASLLRGPELLYDFYDHPDLVRDLLELCCESLIKASKIKREIINQYQDIDYGIGCDDVYLPPGKGKIFAGETYAESLSPEMYREFIKPIHRKFYEAFGGAAIHTCGRHLHLFKEFLDLPVSMIRFYGGAVPPEKAREAVGVGRVVLFGVKTSASGGAVATKEELEESFKILAPGGGYILGPDGWTDEIMEVIKENKYEEKGGDSEKLEKN